MTITLRKAIVGLAAAVSLTLAGAAPALAGTGPVNAPTAVTGTFACTDLASGAVTNGTYVINAGNAQVQTWEAAHLTLDSGATGVFISTAQTIDTPTPVVKGSATLGPEQCSISFPGGAGTVWGKIVITG